MNDLSQENRRILDRMPLPDRLVTTIARIKGDVAQLFAGTKRVDDFAAEIGEQMEDLREMAIRDSLTGAWNKHYMNAVLHHEVRSRERKTSNLGLFFLDIDHFKDINDAEPDRHEAGDRTLIALKKILEETCGEELEVGRWGGEEWVILFAGADWDEMKQLGQKMGNAVRMRLAKDARLVRSEVTASIGVVMYRPGESAKDLVGRADRAMYQAKELNRNRMVVAGDTQEVIEFGS